MSGKSFFDNSIPRPRGRVLWYPIQARFWLEWDTTALDRQFEHL